MQQKFLKSAISIALPVALQCMLQSSFSIVDQLMIGQLGSTSITALGLAGKFCGIYHVVLGAIMAVCGIMISQFIGKNDHKEVCKSFYINLFISFFLSVLFLTFSLLIPHRIISIYSEDLEAIETASIYLKLVSFTFFPLCFLNLFATFLRCYEKASYPLYATMVSALLNTVLNYILIFGRFGFPALGVRGAALATIISTFINLLILAFFFVRYLVRHKLTLPFSLSYSKSQWVSYLQILVPLLICEGLWVLGENAYAIVYGRLGTSPCASMTLSYPVQGLLIGALSGISQASGVLVGKSLGSGSYDEAYKNSKRLIIYGFVGSLMLSALLLVLKDWYLSLYNIEESVRQTGGKILIAFAILMPVKVSNMISGGILKSGGNTKNMLFIDITGTWLIGVPIGFITAFIFKLEITYVYFLLSMEECVRLLMCYILFRRRTWMKTL